MNFIINNMEEILFKAIGEYGALAVTAFMAWIIYQISTNHLTHITSIMTEVLNELKSLREDIKNLINKDK